MAVIYKDVDKFTILFDSTSMFFSDLLGINQTKLEQFRWIHILDMECLYFGSSGIKY